MESVIVNNSMTSWKSKLKDYNQLIKFRLTFTVVLSSVLGFMLGSSGAINFFDLAALIIGGFLVVSSSNGINQIIEKDFDKLMTRTANRPNVCLRFLVCILY